MTAPNARPLCPFCEVGHLSVLTGLIICAYCHKAWQVFEFELDLRQKERDADASTQVPV